MGQGLFPDDATIYIVDAGTSPASLAATDAVTGEVTNYSESGGEEDIESLPVFGGGNVDKENPRTQFEVSFDVILQFDPPQGAIVKWDTFKYGSGAASDGESVGKDIYVQWFDGDSSYYTRAYQNARAVSWNPSMAVEGNLEGSITFKLSPTDASGAANFKAVEDQATAVTW